MSIAWPPIEQIKATQTTSCKVARRLLDSFGEAVQELLQLHEHQLLAVVEGDSDCSRFDVLIHMANERKHEAKYLYLCHLDAHSCTG